MICTVSLLFTAIADSLLECLQLHGLDEFISYLELSAFLSILNSTTDSHLTLFVPTNEAIQRANLPEPFILNMLVNISNMIGNHIVPGNVTMDSLKQFGAKIYTNLEGRHLHRVSVSFGDYSFVSYAENPYYSVPSPTVDVIVSHSLYTVQPVSISCSVPPDTIHQWSRGGD